MPPARKKKGVATKSKPKGPVSKTKTPISSAGPATPQPEENLVLEDSEGESDDGQTWCICNGPDDGRKMINCDNCENWFHLKCLKIPDVVGDLIKDFYCPACTDETHRTMYNPHCTLSGCMKPARVDLHPTGGWKYCSDDHGVKYVAQIVKKMGGQTQGNFASSGGPLSQSQLLAILDGVKTQEEWEALGSKPKLDIEKLKAMKAKAKLTKEEADSTKFSTLTLQDRLDIQPRSSGANTPATSTMASDYIKPEPLEEATVSEVEDEGLHLRGGGLEPTEKEEVVDESLIDPGQYDEQLLNEDEMARMQEIQRLKQNVQNTIKLYERKADLVNAIKEKNMALFAQAKKLEPSTKGMCGFDTILGLNDLELAALFLVYGDLKTLAVPELTHELLHGNIKLYGQYKRVRPKKYVKVDKNNDNDEKMEGTGEEEEVEYIEVEDDSFEEFHSTCIKRDKKCVKHGDWLKIFREDTRYQSILALKALARLAAEEKEIREVAEIRALVEEE